MIVPDVNLLLYAMIQGLPDHPQAKRWLEETLSGGEEVGLTTPAIYGFIRLATNLRVFDRPMEVTRALDYVEGWLQRPFVTCLLPGPKHFEIAFRLLRALGVGGNLTTDVQIAALAIEYQAVVHSNDTDFARFEGLRWVNPLS